MRVARNSEPTPTLAVDGLAPITFDIQSLDAERSALSIFNVSQRSFTAPTVLADDSQLGVLRLTSGRTTYALVASTSTNVTDEQVQGVWNSLRSLAKESRAMVETEVQHGAPGIFRSWGSVKQGYR